MTDWKPGDVAIVKFSSGDHRALLDEDGTWLVVGKENSCGYYIGRPLAVIDPEDTEAVERLVDGYRAQSGWVVGGRSDAVEAMLAALREFANPTLPRIWTDGDVVQHRSGNYTAQREDDGDWRTTAQHGRGAWADDAYVTRGVEAGDFIVLREQAAEVPA